MGLHPHGTQHCVVVVKNTVCKQWQQVPRRPIYRITVKIHFYLYHFCFKDYAFKIHCKLVKMLAS